MTGNPYPEYEGLPGFFRLMRDLVSSPFYIAKEVAESTRYLPEPSNLEKTVDSVLPK